MHGRTQCEQGAPCPDDDAARARSAVLGEAIDRLAEARSALDGLIEVNQSYLADHPVDPTPSRVP
ncbi:hypothetical protein [Amycolatopsis sp. NPDC004079]|uniref:hypothetical protein n=1 Tax=Amycolatopsis sp. NPDC004079 TaxID=3154549 RepID=UPI0033AB5108